VILPTCAPVTAAQPAKHQRHVSQTRPPAYRAKARRVCVQSQERLSTSLRPAVRDLEVAFDEAYAYVPGSSRFKDARCRGCRRQSMLLHEAFLFEEKTRAATEARSRRPIGSASSSFRPMFFPRFAYRTPFRTLKMIFARSSRVRSFALLDRAPCRSMAFRAGRRYSHS